MRVLACLLLFAAFAHAEPPAPIGGKINDFEAPAADAKAWSLLKDGREAKAVVVLFLGTECPVGNAYAPTVAKLHKTFMEKGVTFVGVNSNANDTPADIAKHSKEFGIPFPVLADPKAKIADLFSADRLPEAFVLDGTRTVRYRGRIDNQFERAVKRLTPSEHYLADALEAVLAGKEVAKPFQAVTGCPISREGKEAKESTVTYTKHVAAILAANCQECHRPKEIAPFSLLDYKQAKGWSRAIKEVVSEGIMPPWHADAKPGHFKNDRRLPETDKKTLLAWIDAGCPEGDPKDLPKPREFVEGWRIGKPDMVLEMNREKKIPAQGPKGGMPYTFVLAGKPFEEDKWVTAAEVRPGDRGVLHHVIAYVFKPGMKLPKEDPNILDQIAEAVGGPSVDLHDMLVAYVPGDNPTQLPEGSGKLIPKGSQIVFELHYTPNGKESIDRSSVGLVFAKEKPKTVVKPYFAAETDFVIPAGADDHKVYATLPVTADCTLLSLSPHMHLRGKAFEYVLVNADGTKETLLNIPKYDFNWQASYILKEPKELKKGSRIVCTARYDNSTANPFNPDPKKQVRWGDQTWEEMMIGFVEVARPAK